jgi:DeoR family fructose operon transcriptional repressor
VPKQRLFAEQRRSAILRHLTEFGRVDSNAIAEEMAVTHESVRKDLLALEARGLLRRVHGGAIPVQKLTYEPNVDARTDQMEEKIAIARAALEFVPSEGTILLDAGSSVAQLANILPADRNLVVYTGAISIAVQLSRVPNIVVATLGGRIRGVTTAEVGPTAISTLRSLNVDVAFLGTNAFSFERGLTTPDEDEAEVKREMLSSASQRIFLVDHTKFANQSAHQHALLSDIDLLITDSGTSAAHLSALAAAGVDIKVV